MWPCNLKLFLPILLPRRSLIRHYHFLIPWLISYRRIEWHAADWWHPVYRRKVQAGSRRHRWWQRWSWTWRVRIKSLLDRPSAWWRDPEPGQQRYTGRPVRRTRIWSWRPRLRRWRRRGRTRTHGLGWFHSIGISRMAGWSQYGDYGFFYSQRWWATIV